MNRYQKFLLHFFLSFLALIVGVVGFVTWVDPFRNLNYPWGVSFISDRNIAYKKFKLLEEASQVTDLIIGSSTSEVFVPKVLSERYGTQVFSASAGGASLPLRYLLIKQALKTQPQLKRIIYVADLFEFFDPKLENSVYFQPEMMSLAEDSFFSQFKPEWTSRFNDYFSSLVVDRSIRTFKDFRKERDGKYRSAYFKDGSTTQSMIGGRGGDVLRNRALASAVGMQTIYGKMTDLNPKSIQVLGELVELVKNQERPIELHLIVSPFHEDFYNHFKKDFEKTGVYSKWIETLKDAQSRSGGKVVVHDFSYPKYLQDGITLTDRFWQDGVHFTSETMLKMTDQIFNKL